VKVFLLAGGMGTRMAEYTETVPKPMVTIGKIPILCHIMQHYMNYGLNDFVIALGYKAKVIKEYFHHYSNNNSVDWNIKLVETGLNTMTGGRVKKLKKYADNQTFLLTYGDGLADINISRLIEFHKDHGKLVTVSAVHPTARFGEIKLQGNRVISFKEKPQTTSDWINGGYFVIEPEFFELIDGENTILEHDPLEIVAQKGELMAYCHDGFWQCMDTKRERDQLEELWNSGSAPWQI